MDFMRDCASEMNISLDDKMINKLNTYQNLLLEWNEKMNLTAITDPEQIAIKHFVDSLIPYKEFTDNSSIIDVGSGAGFPSVPLSIINNTLKITALDSLNKRLTFLKEVKDTIGLTELTFVHGRAEDLGRDQGYREKFDFATARAVAPLNILAELCLPFVKVGGYFIAYKGDKWEEEIKQASNAINLLGGEIDDSYQYTLPKITDSRSIIKVKKIKTISSKYPRKAGVPNKKPLT